MNAFPFTDLSVVLPGDLALWPMPTGVPEGQAQEDTQGDESDSDGCELHGEPPCHVAPARIVRLGGVGVNGRHRPSGGRLVRQEALAAVGLPERGTKV